MAEMEYFQVMTEYDRDDGGAETDSNKRHYVLGGENNERLGRSRVISMSSGSKYNGKKKPLRKSKPNPYVTEEEDGRIVGMKKCVLSPPRGSQVFGG